MATVPVMKRLAGLLLAVLAVTACSGIDRDKALDEQLDSGDRSDFVDGLVEGAGGIIVRSEAQCWSDAVIATGATPADLERFGDDPLAPSSAEYAALLAECVDPGLDVGADVPIEGEVRAGFLEGLELGGLTSVQAACVLDELADAGFDGRDLFLAGVLPEAQTELIAGFDQAAVGCL
jgi:hypothetical protein